MSLNEIATSVVVKLATDFSGREPHSLDERIAADLGIDGGDYVEFMTTLEEKFAVDMRVLTESDLVNSTKANDNSLREIIDFIISHK